MIWLAQKFHMQERRSIDLSWYRSVALAGQKKVGSLHDWLVAFEVGLAARVVLYVEIIRGFAASTRNEIHCQK